MTDPQPRTPAHAASRTPAARDLRLVALILKSLSDVERMGDYAVHVAEDGVELAHSPALKRYVNLDRMLQRLIEMSQNLRTGIADRDVTRAEHTIEMDDEVDELQGALLGRHHDRLPRPGGGTGAASTSRAPSVCTPTA